MVPPLDHLPTFITVCRSTLLKGCKEVAMYSTDLMGFDLPWEVLATLEGGMRIHYGGANPPGNRGCSKLLTHIIILKGNKQAASGLSQLWVLSHVSVMSGLTGQLGAPKSDLPVGTAGMYQESLTWLGL